MNNGMRFIKLQGIFRNIKLNSFVELEKVKIDFDDIRSVKCFLNKIEIGRKN